MNNLSLDEINEITTYLKLSDYSKINKLFENICKIKAGSIINRNVHKWFICLKTNNTIQNINSRFYKCYLTPIKYRHSMYISAMANINSEVVMDKLENEYLQFESDCLDRLISIGVSDIQYLEDIAFKYYNKFYVANYFKKSVFLYKNLNSDQNIRNFLYSTINMTMDFVDPAMGLVEDEISYITILLLSAYSSEISDFIFRRVNFIYRRDGWKKAIRSMHLDSFQ